MSLLPWLAAIIIMLFSLHSNSPSQPWDHNLLLKQQKSIRFSFSSYFSDESRRRSISLFSTVAHNCHIKTKCSQQITNRSHQIQIAHIKFKSLTANSNRSQRITNHSQQITKRSQQIQIAHSKFKSFTSNYKSLTPLGVFG